MMLADLRHYQRSLESVLNRGMSYCQIKRLVDHICILSMGVVSDLNCPFT